MFQTIKLSTLVFLFLSNCLLSLTAMADVGQLSNDQLKKMMDENIPVIDIRRLDEWQSTGVIKNSHLLTFFDARGNYDMDKWLAEVAKFVNKDQKVILVCRSGNRTGMVSKFLDSKLGFTQVYHLQHGINDWIRAKNSVVPYKSEMSSSVKNTSK